MAIIDVTGRYPLASVWWRGEYTPADITDIALHHTVTGELPVDASLDDELAVLDCIYTFHVNTRVFGGIGYHGIAFPSGRAYKTCPLNRWGAHVAFENNHLWGFAAAGDYTNSVPPEGTLRGLGKLIALADKTRAIALPLRPHLKWGGTSCPGRRWPEWVPQLRDFTAQEQEDDMAWFIQTTGSPVCVTDFIQKWPVPNRAMKEELEATGGVKPGVIPLSTEAFNRIKMTHTPGTDGQCRFKLPLQIS